MSKKKKKRKKRTIDPVRECHDLARRIIGPVPPSRRHSGKKGKKGYSRRRFKKFDLTD